MVSPALDVEIIKRCSRCRVAVMPGTTTLKDVVMALECGINVDKADKWIRFGCVSCRGFDGWR
ncbi:MULTISPECIES: hypothetical protein [Megasphaera]|uniref:hypothetical protein n=1 Tax=Megasphaera TaxID=906 RepID=UPI001CD764E1|nr:MULTISPECIES: hypothetical protein [Megasphaera]MBS5214020.1 hypothetical protein [Megasphaera sp.]MCB5736564.1 hypothetical protein [Megasphaera massiliensis]UBS52853.1 hypothetical protein LCQ47_08040 [Megasphaera massiliensis]